MAAAAAGLVLLGACPAAADTWDPGDDTGPGATVLTLTTTFQFHGAHTLSATDTADWFQFSAIAGYTYFFSTFGGAGNSYGELFAKANGTQLEVADDDAMGGGQFGLFYLAAKSQSYYLKVTTNPTASTWSGSLSYYVMSPLIGVGAATPSIVTEGQWTTLSLTVTNTGPSTISGIFPSVMFVSGLGATLTLQSGPLPAGPVTLASGAAQTFNWTYSTTGNGFPQVFLSATGLDAGLGQAVQAIGIATFTVTGAARLAAVVAISPDPAPIGSWINVVLTVTNTGGNAANGVTPAIQMNQGGASLAAIGGPLPPGPVVLAPGVSQSFTWTYSVSGNGTASFTGTATGTDAVSGLPVSKSATDTSTLGLAPAQLAGAATASTLAPLVGQWFQVRLTVTNTGGNAATGVTPAIQVNTGGALATLQAGPVPPGPVTLAGGAAQTFVWTYSANGAGSINFTATAAGAEQGTGTPVQASGSVTVSPVAGGAWTTSGLWHAIADGVAPGSRPFSSSSPSTWWYGQDATGNFATGVRTTGDLTSPAMILGAGYQLSFWSWEQTEGLGSTWDTRKVYISVNGGGSWTQLLQLYGTENVWHQVLYDLSAYGGQTVLLRFTFDSLDGTANNYLGWFVDEIAVTAPPPLKGALSASPPAPAVGQWTRLVLTVTNTGGANVTGVLPAIQINAGAGLVTFENGPTPAGPLTLAPGASQSFTWSYSATGAGTVSFTATAAGTDAGTGSPTFIAVTKVVVIPPPAQFVASLAVTPIPIAAGQWFTVALTVTNTGGVSATGVLPGLQMNAGGGLAVQQTGPVPSGPVTLGAGAAQTFVWTYSANGAGAVSFTGTAAGNDAGSGAVVSGSASWTGSLTSLRAALAIDPATAAVGQWVRIVLTVTNTGGFNITGVLPALQINAGAALVVAQAGPSPAGPLTLAPGASQSFTWTYSVSGGGSSSWTATAAGTDAGAGAAVSASASGILLTGARVLFYGPTAGGAVLATPGIIATIWSATTWAAATTPQFAAFDAIVLGETPLPTTTAVWATALANRTTWSQAVSGNIVTYCGDPELHGNTQISQQALLYALSSPGTGLVVALGSVYEGVAPAQDVSILGYFGLFGAGDAGCPSLGHKVSQHPALAPITDASISYSCGTHGAFVNWPDRFTPLLIATNATGTTYYAPDGTTGQAYMLGTRVTDGLRVRKSANPPGAVYAATLTYTLGWRNYSSATVNAITLYDTLPNGTVYRAPSLAFFAQPDGAGTPTLTGSAWATSAAGPWTAGEPADGTGTPLVLRWNVNRVVPDASGTISFQAQVSGTLLAGSVIANRAIGYSAAATCYSEPAVNVTSSPPALVSSLTVAPNTVYAGQWFQVVLATTNTGGSAATGVVPSVQLNSGGALVTLEAGPSPAGPVTILPGAAQFFTWTYSAGGLGIVEFTGTAVGAAVASNGATASATISVLRAAIAVSPGAPVVGQWIQVTLTVTNGGSASVTGLTPSILVNQGGALLVAQGGPVPTGPLTLSAGTAQTFTWTYSVSGAGAVILSATGTGTDSGSGLTVLAGRALAFATGGYWLPTCGIPYGLIATHAGTGVAGYNGDGIAAPTARINQPYGVATDSAGNVFIADYNNHRIRKVAAGTGLISTVAGTGAGGFNGDGIAATAAQLYFPSGVTTDSAGNLYIFDSWNQRVRKVTVATGVISTIAGTGAAGYNGDGIPATSAQIYYGSWGAVDAAGNVYICDLYNSRIRKVTLATGLISTVAGTGFNGYNGDGIAATAAQVNNASGVALDGAGNWYICDNASNRIRKVNAATGLISTVAGTGVAGYNGDGIAATSAQLNTPYAIAVDAAGNILIADTGGSRVRRVDAGTGLISTVAGTGVSGYNGDGIAATAAQLISPVGIALDSSCRFYVVEGARVRRIESAVLQAAVAVTPPSQSLGRWVQVVLTVTNVGSANVTGLVPVLGLTSGGALAAYETGPSPAGPLTLLPGASQSFTWTYSCSGQGTVAFSVTASGTDSGTGSPASVLTTGAWTIASILRAALATTPASAAPGTWFQVALTVTNTGVSSVNGVTPSLQVNAGPGVVVYQSGPAPAGPVVLAPGAAQTFLWTYSASGLGAVSFTGTAAGLDSGTGLPVLAAATALFSVGLSLPEAVDNLSLPWTTGGSSVWNPQTAVSFFGGDAAQSGPLGNSQSNYLQTTVTGPGTLTFYWKVDSEFGYDYLTFLIDGVPQTGAISGNVGWTLKTYAIGAGVHTLRWQYSKDISIAVGADAGWVDQVVFTTLAASLAVTPGAPVAGQWFQAVLTVTNTGSANVTGLVPAMLANTGGGLVVYQSGPSPAGPLTLAPGTAQSFVWTYSASGAGTVLLTGTGSGTDAGTGNPASATAARIFTIVPPAALVASVAVSPATSVPGQWFTVRVTVTNTGGVAATGVTAALQADAGAALVTLQSGPVPPGPFTLAAGGAQTFVWTFSANGWGSVFFSGTATGTDSVLGRPLAVTVAGMADITSLKAALAITPSLAPVGALVRFVLSVTNTGAVSVTGILPSIEANAGGGFLSGLLGPSPAGPLTLAPGASQRFTWTGTATASGTVVLTATGAGTDSGSGTAVSAASTRTLTITTPAALVSALAITPDVGCAGQWITVTMTITNTGGSTATNVNTSLGIGFPAIPLALKSGPTPGGLLAISGGGTQVIAWTYSVGGAGPAPFYSSVTATDSLLGGGLSTNASHAGVYGTSAALSASASPVPATASVGQWMNVVLTVANSGDSPANAVLPALTVVSGGALLAAQGGPVPAGPVMIAGLSAQAFTWTFSVNGSGAAAFSFTATGTDSCSGAARTASAATAVALQTAANLTGSIACSTTTLRQGQTVTLTMTVTNTGQASVVAAIPVPFAASAPAGAATKLSGPVPSGSVAIAGGASRTFTWVYEAVAIGIADFSATVAGADANSGRPVQAGATSPPVQVTLSAVLKSLAVTLPGAVKQGETFELRLTVTNTGAVGATGVAAAAGVADPSAARIVSGPTPVGGAFGGSLAPGAAVTWSWLIEATRAGTVTLAPSAAGVDAGDGTVVTTQAAAVEVVELKFTELVVVYPNPVAGDSFTVALKLDEDADLVEVEAFNLAMQRVFSGNWAAVTAGTGEVTVSGVRTWAPGPYLLRIRATLRSGAKRKFLLQKVVVRR